MDDAERRAIAEAEEAELAVCWLMTSTLLQPRLCLSMALIRSW